MLFSASAVSVPLTTLPQPIVYHNQGHGWLCQPGASATTVLSLHTRQGRRVRQVSSQFMDLNGLPAAEYLLRVQLPGGSVYVLPVVLD